MCATPKNIFFKTLATFLYFALKKEREVYNRQRPDPGKIKQKNYRAISCDLSPWQLDTKDQL
jgi:hypothetical protein